MDILIDWLRHGFKPSLPMTGGLVAGFAGVAILMGGIENLGQTRIDLASASILVFGAFLWANGSLYSRSSNGSSSPLQATAQQMMMGGLLLLCASLTLGEWNRVNIALISIHSIAAWVYLVVFGSLLGFTSYIWLLQRVTLARASTYAYVNPVVAMILGWQIAQEPITPRTILAAAVILAAVVLITAYQAKTSDKPTNENSSDSKLGKRDRKKDLFSGS